MKMVGPSSPLPSLQIFSLKSSLSSSSSSSTTLIFVKFKTFIQTLIFSHICRFARSISKAKTALIQILKENYHNPSSISFKKNKNKILFGSFRLHYNWCSSSHVMPIPAWESVDGAAVLSSDSHQLSGYLQWLEEKKEGGEEGDDNMNEIDRLAEMFIADCHEKFRLEKQESYRKFQAMMARSM